MGKASVPLRLTLLISFSLTASYSFSPCSSLKQSPPSIKATPSDLLSLLGPKSQSCSIDPHLAHHLSSCLKFLVPFTPKSPEKLPGRKILTLKQKGQREREEDELVWWPPQAVMDLARLAVDSGGDSDAIHRALDPTMITVPDVEGCEENRCQLTRTPYGRHFIRSNVAYDDSMNLRNILWLDPLLRNSAKGWEAPGVLVVLDARPDGIIYRDLIPEYVDFARTIYEDDLGEVAVDVNYLDVGNPGSKYQLFIC